MALSAMPAISAARRNFEIIVVITFPCFSEVGRYPGPNETRSGCIAEACRLTFFLVFFQPMAEQSTLGALHKL
ncbi:hypothetical protein [Mesorhizobium ciceri]|uniref:hypothetical protein n=1 Tax=Mesorhizobium TaxID=68287 RepID=UPI0018CC61AE|nr:hypothetical protein [Mesorhizobium ciceri]